MPWNNCHELYCRADGVEVDTASVSSFEFEHEGYQITLIDTPGFNDTTRSESEVLKEIADWLDWTYRNPPHLKLNGILYLQSIMDPRIFGSSLRNLKMFKDLCGEDPLKNVILVTSKWGLARKSGQEDLAWNHERQLRNDRQFWAPMVEKGSRMARFEDTQDSALQIILSVVDQSPVLLQIQAELVDESKNLIDTAAGNTVNEEMIKLEKKYKDEISQIQKEMDEALAARDVEVQEALQESKENFERRLDKLRDEQAMLQYERRNDARRMQSVIDDLQTEMVKKHRREMEEQLGAQKLDFDQTVQKLLANEKKLRKEQSDAMQQKIDEISRRPQKDRTGRNLVIGLLPTLGGLALSLLGIPLGLGAGAGGFGS